MYPYKNTMSEDKEWAKLSQQTTSRQTPWERRVADEFVSEQ